MPRRAQKDRVDLVIAATFGIIDILRQLLESAVSGSEPEVKRLTEIEAALQTVIPQYEQMEGVVSDGHEDVRP